MRLKRALVLLSADRGSVPSSAADEIFAFDGGRGDAIRTALAATTADALCFYDPADGQDPNDVPKLFEALEAGGYDMVVAARPGPGRAFTFLANMIWNRGPYLTDALNGLRAARADSLRRCGPLADGPVGDYRMAIRMMKLGMRIGEVAVREGPRRGGRSGDDSWPARIELVRQLIREISTGRRLSRG
jgi:hypothetical protein